MVQEQSSSHHHHPQLPRYGSGNGNGTATGVARASKKNKTKKIPQRGLGVAQLEKLRIEEQKKMEGATASGTTHALSGGGGGLGHLLPLHPPPPPLPPSALPRPAADGGVHCGFPPVLWDPADPMKHPCKRSLCPPPPLPMVSTGLSLTASSSSSHPTEPPSNQMYSSSGSRSAAPADEDREAAGVDRSWPFMFEGMTAAAFRTTGKATPVVPFVGRTTREARFADVCPDLSRHEFRATNYFSTKAIYSDWGSDFAHYKSSKENGCAGEPAFLTMSSQPAPLMKQSHVIPSIHLPEYNEYGVMPSQQGSISASASQPFYSFLPAGPVRCERALSDCKADVSDGVDLELKL